MQRSINSRLVTHWITAVLLFGIAFAAGAAEQMMRALPSPAVQSTAARALGAGAPQSVPTPITLYPDIVADRGGVSIGNNFVAFKGSIAIKSTTAAICPLTGSFTLKNVGGGSPSSVGANGFDVTIVVEQPPSGTQAGKGKIASTGWYIPNLQPGATYAQDFGFELKPGSYVIWLNIDPYHKLKQATPNMKQYYVQLSCGDINSVLQMPAPAGKQLGIPPKLGTPGTTPTPTQLPPGQSMGGGLRMGSALTPATQPAAQPPQSLGFGKHSTPAHAEAPQNRGVALLNPDAACGSDNTPRIININGRQSGVDFKPGDSLNIAGCGFGKGGEVALSMPFGKIAMKGGGNIPLVIDGWSESNIHAHIDAALSGMPDFGNVRVRIKPNSAAVIESPAGDSFRAARADTVVALPAELASYSQLDYGAPITSNAGAFTRVSRKRVKDGFCPPVTNQRSEMHDLFPLKFLNNGFKVVSVNYTNETDQKNGDSKDTQWVLVGNGGSATHSSYGAVDIDVDVIFQGHSTYVKKGFLGAGGGKSTCTSSYTVSLTVSGPRGIPPALKSRSLGSAPGGMAKSSNTK